MLFWKWKEPLVYLLFIFFEFSSFAADTEVEFIPAEGKALKGIRYHLNDKVTLTLRQLPAGDFPFFENRKPEQDEKTDKDGKIIHHIGADQLAIGEYEITQAQWSAVMGTNQEQLRNRFNPEAPLYGVGENYPVYYVSVEDAKEFCRKLNRKFSANGSEFEFDLPNVWEWIYACRAGTDTQLNNGKNIVWSRAVHRGVKKPVSNELNEVAWYAENAGGTTHPVGGKTPNAWGLYDMHGNVDELTSDWIDEAFSGLDLSVRMGGSWHAKAGACTSDGTSVQNTPDSSSNAFEPTTIYREPIMKDTISFSSGFRVVLRKKTAGKKKILHYEEKTLHPEQIKGLAVLACFMDDKESQVVEEAKINRYLNDIDYKGDGNTCSAAGYVYHQSRGRCILNYDIFGYYFAQNDRSYYRNTQQHAGGEKLIREVAKELKTDVDYAKYTHSTQGRIRAYSTLYSGQSSFDGLWPCQMWLWPPNEVYFPGRQVKANSCILCGTGERLRISILVHETIHQVFGIGDYVDYGAQSSKTPRDQQKASHGLGRHCIMGIGMYDPKTGDTNNPASLCGPFRYRLGWMTVIPLPASGKVRVPATGNYAYIYRNPANPYEYFLLENRNSGMSFDNVLPSHGLAIWHVDESVADKSENEEMTEEKHYEVSLEQAHGKFLLEQADCGPFSNFHHKRDCNGTAEDYFYPPKHTKFGDSTTPDSKWWNGKSSGLEITDMELDGKDIIITIGKVPSSLQNKNP